MTVDDSRRQKIIEKRFDGFGKSRLRPGSRATLRDARREVIGDYAVDGSLAGQGCGCGIPAPARRNKRGKSAIAPSPDAALGDADTAARRPYLF